MKPVKCPNCGNEIVVDESSQYLSCGSCGKCYVNPYYVEKKSADTVDTENTSFDSDKSEHANAVLRCASCSATLPSDDSSPTLTCPVCGRNHKNPFYKPSQPNIVQDDTTKTATNVQENTKQNNKDDTRVISWAYCPQCGNSLDLKNGRTEAYCDHCKKNFVVKRTQDGIIHLEEEKQVINVQQNIVNIQQNIVTAPAKVGESKFTGTYGSLLGNRIVNSLISLFTLGFGIPWVICRSYRWEVDHTVIDGRRLKFDGTGGKLIGSWIKWMFLTLITCGIYGLWVPLKKRAWIVEHSHIEGLAGESKFTGGLASFLGLQIVNFFILIFTLGLGVPWVVCRSMKWDSEHQIIDGRRIYFDGNAAQLFGNWIKWILLTIVTFGIYSILIPIRKQAWIVKHQSFVKPVGNSGQSTGKQIDVNSQKKKDIGKIVGCVLAVACVIAVIVVVCVTVIIPNIPGRSSGGSGNSINGGTEDGIIEIKGGTVDGNEVTLFVSPSVDSVDLFGKITLSEGFSWQLYADYACETRIPTQMAESLDDGVNLYYIVVVSSDGRTKRTYTLSIFKNYYTDIYFYSDSGVLLDTWTNVLSQTTLNDHSDINYQGYTYSEFNCEDWCVTEKDKRFYAGKATPNTYTITLNPNGGSVSSRTKQVTYDDAFILEVPTRTGYTFSGWYDGDTKVTSNTGKSRKDYLYTYDKTLTAEWEINEYKVTLNTSGGGGTVSGAGKYDYNSRVTITATTNAGYTWLGWYDGTTKVSENLTYTFTIPTENKTYTAKWSKVTLAITPTEAGSVTSLTGQYNVGDEVTITATTNSGYTWLGWYDGNTKVSEGTSMTYTFTMPAVSKTFTAKWMECPITLEKNIPGAGTVSFDRPTALGAQTTIIATTNSGYTWLGWYDGDTKVSEGTSLTYTFTMSTDSKTYAAKWSKVTLATTPTEAGSVTSLTGQYNVGDEATVTATTNAGYTWLGWYDGDTKVSEGTSMTYTFTMSTENKTYTAKWSKVTLATTPTEAGSVTSLTGKYNVGDEVTVTATTNTGYTWLGWYDGDTKVSEGTSMTYTFTMPTESKTYTAKWAEYYVTVEKNMDDAGDVYRDGGKIGDGSITFNLNGGSGVAPATQISGTATYPSIPTRSGYIFAGWYDNQQCTGSPYDFTQYVMSPTTLYAKWISYSGTGVLNLNSSQSISVVPRSNSTAYYAFVPLTDGQITIYTTGDLDTYGYLYNSSKTQLSSNDDSAGNHNFKITYNVTAGTLYYVRPCGYSSSGTTTIHLEGAIPEDGAILSDPSTKMIPAGEEVALTATTNAGYTWLGWYDGDTKVSEDLTYTFTMAAGSKTYTAKWSKVTIESNNSSAGTVSSLNDKTYVDGEEVTVTATTNLGYTWLGWYDGETLVCEDTSYTFIMPAENKTYTAKWACYTVSTETNLNGAGTYTVKIDEKVAVGETVELTATTNPGYTWLGWYDGDVLLTADLTYTLTMPAENKTNTAKWMLCPVNLEKNIAEAGIVSGVEGATAVGEETTVTATTNPGYTWLGWYNGDALLTTDLTYTFTMSVESKTYTAKWAEYYVTVEKNMDDAGDVYRDGGKIGDGSITFNLNGGSGVAPATQISGTATYPSIPTRSGYVFAGWYDNQSCTGSPYDFTQDVTADITLYAKWISYSGTGVLTLNSSQSISVVSKSSSTYHYYAFVPLTDGQITIYTTGSLDTYGYLYDSSKSQLTYDDQAGDGSNFKITYNVTAGTLYYIRPCGWNTSGTTTIYLQGDLPEAGGTIINSPNAVMITAGEAVELAATTNPRYTWLGWYDGDTKVSEGTSMTYTFTMPAENKTYTAKWMLCPVTLEKNIPEAGTVSGVEGATAVGGETTITATTNAGYTWLGWYDGDTKVSEGTSMTYTFTMPAENKTYTAKWMLCPVTLEKNIPEAGTVSGVEGATAVGGETTITATTNAGYTWLGWYDGDALVCEDTTYTFTMSAESKTYTAKWACYTVSTETNLDGAGTYTIKTDEKVVVGETVELNATTNAGYTWLGWYDGDVKLCDDTTYTFTMPAESKAYTAKWAEYYVTTEKNMDYAGSCGIVGDNCSITFDLNGGSGIVPATQNSGIATYPTTIPTRDGYVFAGWYDNQSCTGSPYDFTQDVTADITLYAKWISYSGTGVLTLNSSQSISVVSKSSSTAYYAFVPLTDGQVTIYTTGSLDTYGYLYDSSKSQLASNDDVNGTNFRITYNVTAGTLYYVRPCGYSSSGTTTIYLQGDLPEAGGTIANSPSAKMIAAGETVTVTANTNPGYTWLGWYDGDTKVSEGTSMTYAFTMTTESKTYTAKWSKVTIESNNSSAGTVSSLNDKTYVNGEEVIVTATTNAGYTWLGWYDGDTKVSEGTSMTYTFTMSTENKTYTAKWTYYTVSTETDIEGAGTYTGYAEEKVSVGETVTLTATTNTGYTWLGWYDGDTKVSDDLTYTFTMSTESKTYTAKWEVRAEMQNFYFTSTSTTCTITGIKDETVTSIVVPDYVTEISAGAFNGCSSLESITIPFVGAKAGVTNSDKYQYPLGYIFGTSSYTGCVATEQYYYGSSTSSTTDTTYYIPSSLKSVAVTGGNILYGAFWRCSMLTSIVIPDSVTNIGSYAFYYCRKLTNIIIPDSVTTIDSWAFRYCTSLTSIVIPDSVTTIGSYAFEYCYKLVEVYNKSNLTITAGSTSNGYVGYYALNVYTEEGGSKLTTDEDGYIIYTDGSDKILVGYVGEQTDLIIPDGIKEIYKYAFYSCFRLTSIVIPDSVTTIGESAFAGCTGLTSITIPDSVTSIGKNAFYNCTGLTSITIPDSVTTIGSYAFSLCSSLTSITIPDSVTTIDSWTFFDCDSLTSIVIPDSVTTIESSAFEGCNSLTSVTMGDSVTTIGYRAFAYCRSLTSVTIGDSVTTIGDSAFAVCDSLTSVTIGDSVTTIGSYAFNGCTSLTSITIPDSLTSIGDGAFYYCPSLKDVYYTGTEEQWNNISIGSNNSPLTNATRCYYSDCVHDNNQWRYDADGNISTELMVGDWIVDTEPTCTTNGSKHGVCNACGETVALEIPALGHSAGDDGVCTVCGEEIPLYTITNDATYAFIETDGVLQSTNKAHSSSSSYVITAITTITITFEYNVSSESDYDKFYIYHNTTEKVVKSGTSNSYTSYSITLNAGDTLTFKYTKDGSQSSGADCCYIKNLTIT